jgi:Na+-translocating ferredoxin:NAD+ oxidoreductase subunit A
LDGEPSPFEKGEGRPVNIPVMLQIAIGAVLINNFVLARMLGLCPFFCSSRSMPGAFGMGVTITLVMTIASACTWIVRSAVLIPLHITSLSLIVFMLIIATLVQLLEMMMQKFSPKLNETIGMNLPLVTADCAVLAVALIHTQNNPVTGRMYTIIEACVSAAASGVGFAVVLLLMAGIRNKLSLCRGVTSLQGLPIDLIIAGLMAMAFFGFSGLHVTAGGGF